MPRVNWKRPVPCVFCLSLVASICVIALPTGAQQTPVDPREEIARVSKELSEKPSESLAKDALPDRVTALLKAKRDALRRRYEITVLMFNVGVRDAGMAQVTQARVDLNEATLELTTNAADRIKLLRENVGNAASLESQIIALSQAGAIGGDPLTLAVANAATFDAELRLARELVAQQAKDSK